MGTIRIDAVGKQYTDATTVTALTDVSREIESGEFHVVIGPSGSGKTTLLRIVSGLETPTNGSVSLQGNPEIGYLSQEYGLFYWLTVRQNIERMAELTDTAVTDEEIESLLELVGLEERSESLPSELSGGMRQRAALARMLIYEPEILLMDEPFGSLDDLTREQLYDEFEQIVAADDRTILYVTHNLAEAYRFGDRVTVLRDGSAETVLEPGTMDEDRFNDRAHEAMRV